MNVAVEAYQGPVLQNEPLDGPRADGSAGIECVEAASKRRAVEYTHRSILSAGQRRRALLPYSAFSSAYSPSGLGSMPFSVLTMGNLLFTEAAAAEISAHEVLDPKRRIGSASVPCEKDPAQRHCPAVNARRLRRLLLQILDRPDPVVVSGDIQYRNAGAPAAIPAKKGARNESMNESWACRAYEKSACPEGACSRSRPAWEGGLPR